MRLHLCQNLEEIDLEAQLRELMRRTYLQEPNLCSSGSTDHLELELEQN